MTAPLIIPPDDDLGAATPRWTRPPCRPSSVWREWLAVMSAVGLGVLFAHWPAIMPWALSVGAAVAMLLDLWLETAAPVVVASRCVVLLGEPDWPETEAAPAA